MERFPTGLSVLGPAAVRWCARGACAALLCKLPRLCSSADEDKVRLKLKVSDSLKQALAKLKLSESAAETKGESTEPRVDAPPPSPRRLRSLCLFV